MVDKHIKRLDEVLSDIPDDELQRIVSSVDRESKRRIAAMEPYLEPTPTAFVPGSKEKINALRLRLASRECLWHPEDATHETDITDSLKRIMKAKHADSRNRSTSSNAELHWPD